MTGLQHTNTAQCSSAHMGERKLSDVLSRWFSVPVSADRLICGVQLDSRLVNQGDVFVALAGHVGHALDHLDDAVAKGIVALLVDSDDPRRLTLDRPALARAGVSIYELQRLRAVVGEIASEFYAHPTRAMKVVGITGTDGKTSVCELLAQALNMNTVTCATIGTLGSAFNGECMDTGLTTPDAVSLQGAIAEFREKGAGFVAMEVSSHAIDQHRIAGVSFDIAVLTNLGRDHLDYHGDMKCYRAAKEALFHQPELRAAVLNSDDEFGLELSKRLVSLDVFTFGRGEVAGDSHVQVVDVVKGSMGLEFTLKFNAVAYPIQSQLIGEFNIENIAAVFTILLALGVSPELAANSVSKLSPVTGRMQVTHHDTGASIVVDYAHNPHALDSVLRSVAAHARGKVLLVFGCGGDRDRGKRPMMAKIAEQHANRIIVTDDNPRGEDGDEIVRQILQGFSSVADIVVERDRARAIRCAIEQAEAGDWVVVAGKGHEQYQQVGTQRKYFSDSSIVASCVNGVATV